MTRRIGSGGRWEQAIGYSRAVAAGDYVFVSGCTSVDGTQVVYEGDARAQTAQAIANVGAALTGLGASLADVVSTRMFVTDIARWAEYGQAHGEAFGDVAPAATMAQVQALIDPRMLVEVEAVAYRPGIGQAAQAKPAGATGAGQQARPACGGARGGQPVAGQPVAGSLRTAGGDDGRPGGAGRRHDCRRPGHPVPGRRRRAGGQGGQLPRPARCRGPRRARRRLRPGRRR